jgi:hypothetical protein
LKVGSRSEEVKKLQEILKDDSTIYPEGLITGYFGSITEKAIRKIQVRCGLPETGVINEDAVKCIFPQNYQVKVSSPNGGEKWDKDQIQTIKWEVIQSRQEILNDEKKIMPPVWSKASIDLFRRLPNIELKTCTVSPEGVQTCPAGTESLFVKHLATVNLFNNSYSWKIDSDIANGSDYVIRITVGEGIVPMYLYEKGKEIIRPDIWPSPKVNWDESDNPFAIEGQVTPPTSELKQLLEMFEQISLQMTKAIQLLREIISK